MAEQTKPWWLQADFEREAHDAGEKARVAASFMKDAVTPWGLRPKECAGLTTSQLLKYAERNLKQALAHVNICLDNLDDGHEID